VSSNVDSWKITYEWRFEWEAHLYMGNFPIATFHYQRVVRIIHEAYPIWLLFRTVEQYNKPSKE
jgi:hypothetical protein